VGRRVRLRPDDVAHLSFLVEEDDQVFDTAPREFRRHFPRDPGDDPQPLAGPAAIDQRDHADVDGQPGKSPLVQRQIIEVELLLELRVFVEGLRIEVAGLGPDLATLAIDGDLDVVEAAIPSLVDGIAKNIVGPGQSLDLRFFSKALMFEKYRPPVMSENRFR
jgi:hypothetical protein